MVTIIDGADHSQSYRMKLDMMTGTALAMGMLMHAQLQVTGFTQFHQLSRHRHHFVLHSSSTLEIVSKPTTSREAVSGVNGNVQSPTHGSSASLRQDFVKENKWDLPRLSATALIATLIAVTLGTVDFLRSIGFADGTRVQL